MTISARRPEPRARGGLARGLPSMGGLGDQDRAPSRLVRYRRARGIHPGRHGHLGSRRRCWSANGVGHRCCGCWHLDCQHRLRSPSTSL